MKKKNADKVKKAQQRGDKYMSFEEISQILGIRQEEVYEIYVAAIRKIRRLLIKQRKMRERLIDELDWPNKW